MRYFVKKMESNHCVIIVKKLLQDLGISYNLVDICVIELPEKMLPKKECILKSELAENGFELYGDKKGILIEEIKFIICKSIYLSHESTNVNFSSFLSKELGYNYTYLTNVFSELEGITIKQYFITQKMERIKSIILKEDLNLKQIASLMKYKSISHLSNQFKKITGITPSDFKKRMFVNSIKSNFKEI